MKTAGSYKIHKPISMNISNQINYREAVQLTKLFAFAWTNLSRLIYIRSVPLIQKASELIENTTCPFYTLSFQPDHYWNYYLTIHPKALLMSITTFFSLFLGNYSDKTGTQNPSHRTGQFIIHVHDANYQTNNPPGCCLSVYLYSFFYYKTHKCSFHCYFTFN